MWYTVSRSTGHLKCSRAFLSFTKHRIGATHVVMNLCPFIVCVFIRLSEVISAKYLKWSGNEARYTHQIDKTFRP